MFAARDDGKRAVSFLSSRCVRLRVCAAILLAMENELVFICTNDMHCAVAGDKSHLGLDGIAGLASRLRTRYGAANVCLVDAGDALGAGVAGCVSNGEAPLRLMEACGYAAYCPGNADVAFGARRLKELAQMSSFPFVCCNMRDAATGASLLPSYALRHVGGVCVGFVGVATPLCHAGTEAADFAEPDSAIELDCCQELGGRRLVEAVQVAVDAARSAGAHVVVLLSHLGQTGERGEFRSDFVVGSTCGIDLVVDGHSHEVYLQEAPNIDGVHVPIVQGGLELAAASVVVLDKDGRLLEMYGVGRGDADSDDNMSREIAQTLLQYDAMLSCSVCELPLALRARDEAGPWLVRRVETNLGDLVADAVAALFDADIALIPSWVLRDDLPRGAVRVEDVIRVHPLGHRVCAVRVTGAQLLAALEQSVSKQPAAYRYWLQVSRGARVRFDLESHRLAAVTINGAQLDPDATYVLAGLDFMVAGGGSGYGMFSHSEVLAEGVSLVEAIAAYLRSLGPDAILVRYGNAVGGAGRVLCL